MKTLFRCLGVVCTRLRGLLLAGALIGSGCDSSEDGGSALAGTSWRVASWAEASPNPAAHLLTARFADTQVSGTSAVNQYGGSYSAGADGTFAVGALQSTEMAGSPEAMRAESTFHRLLARARQFKREDSRLTLRDGNGASLMVFQPQP